MKPKHSLLSFAERLEIQYLLQQGKNYAEISHVIGRGKNTIGTEVRRSGGRIGYTAQAGQDRYNKVYLQKREKATNLYSTTNNPQTKMRTNIQNLQMQMEILLDAIKELRNELSKDN